MQSRCSFAFYTGFEIPFKNSAGSACTFSADDEEEVIEIFGGCLLPHKCGGTGACLKTVGDGRTEAGAKRKYT